MADLNPETIERARVRGDQTLRFACSNGRENGPYDLDDFSIMRGQDRIAPLSIRVEGKAIIATYPGPLEFGDRIAT